MFHIFGACMFYHDNGTIGLIIHDLNECYFYIYKLLRFIFVAIYDASIVLFEWGTILFTFAYFATFLRLHRKSQRGQLRHGKQVETTTMVLIITRKNDKNTITAARQFLFDLNNVYLLFIMAVILVFILCDILSQLTTAAATTTTYTHRSVYDDYNGNICGLIGMLSLMYFCQIIQVKVVLNDDESVQQDDIFNETKSGAQLDTIEAATTDTVTCTSNGDCDECLIANWT